MIAAVDDDDAVMVVIDRKAIWILELIWLVATSTELGHERASILIAIIIVK